MRSLSIRITSALLLYSLRVLAKPVEASWSRSETITITPAPGLPSVESLGLTMEDLNDPDFMAKNGLNRRVAVRETDFTPICDNGNPQDTVAGAQACMNYLAALGTTACVVSGYNVVFCRASDGSDVGGSNISGGSSASSYCSDVAIGGQWVINNCQVNGYVEGSQAANGNGNLIVTCESYL
ncbi:unnamed protein product [Discula destructiva]